jgi:hypothetical protein
MNIQKSEVKIALTKEFGKRLDEKKQAAVKEQHAMAGEVRALKNAAKKIADLMTHVDKDLKDGKLNEILGEPLLVAKYAKRQYQHAIGVIDNLATQAEVAAHRCAGLEIGFRQSCEFIEKMHAEEMQKLESLRQAIDEGKVKLVGGELVIGEDEASNGPGGHPGLPMKSKRMQEDEQEKKKVPRKKSTTKAAKNKLSLVKDEAKSGTKTDATTIQGVAEKVDEKKKSESVVVVKAREKTGNDTDKN